MARTTVQILDSSLDMLAEVRSLVPLNERGIVLEYSKELDDYGYALFRISTQDPLFKILGDIVLPHKYHVRILRDQKIIWAGAIVDNPQRTKDFVEVKAAEYEFYLDHVLIKRTSAVAYGEVQPTQNIGMNYRIFDSGTMADAIKDMISETKKKLGNAHLMKDLAAGDIVNPDYAPGAVDASGGALKGPWKFSGYVVMQFDYQSVLYAIRSFGVIAPADFRLNADSTFDFMPFIGGKKNNLVFTYGARGNIADYNAPRFGSKMVNSLYGVATDINGVILFTNKPDSPSINTYGLMEGAQAFADVKDSGTLARRVKEELVLLKDPQDSPMNLIMNEKAYPLGQYDVGDIIHVRIKDGAIDYSAPKRIIGISVNLHNTGRELITVQTNTPKPEDLGK